MAFPSYHTFASVWTVLPWTPGALPAITGISCQRLRPFLAVEPTAQGVIIPPGDGLILRTICGPEWPNPLDFSGKVYSTAQLYLTVGGMTTSRECIGVFMRQVHWNNLVVDWSYCVGKLILNPAFYP